MAEAALDESLAVRQARRIAARDIDGRAVVIVIDAQRLHTLNEVGSRVFALADGRTVRAITDAIVDEFDVDRGVARADVDTFVRELVALGALEVGAR